MIGVFVVVNLPNFGTYLKAIRLLKHYNSLNKIASNILISESYLSKLEHNKSISKLLIIDILNYYKISTIVDDNNTILISLNDNDLYVSENYNQLINNAFDRRIERLIDNYFYITPIKKLKINYNDILFPLDLLNNYIFRTVDDNFEILTDKNTVLLQKTLSSIIDHYSNKLKTIYYLSNSQILFSQGDYIKSKEMLEQILTIKNLDKRLVIICKYYLLQNANCLHDYLAAIKHAEELNTLLKSYPNKLREIQIVGEISQTYAFIGNLEFADKIMLNGIETAKDINEKQYMLLSYNLATSLLEQKEYSKAKKHFLNVFDYFYDNTTCFDIAWCYYNEGDKINALKYLSISRDQKIKIHKKYSTYFCDWLEAMINRNYSNKCEKILLRIYKNYERTMHPKTKELLYTLLRDHYIVKKDYEKALKYSMLLNK